MTILIVKMILMVESDNFEVKKGNISAAEDVENKGNQEDSREDSRTSSEDVDDHDGDGGRWLRTRNQVDYREASQNDSFDSEISDIFIGRFR